MRTELDNIIKKYDLIEKTYEHFWKCYDNYLIDDVTKEESQKYELKDRDSIDMEFIGYSYVVSNRYGIDLIEVELSFRPKRGKTFFGSYYDQYTIDGEDFDDYFIID